jgi:hypothetical protein
MVVGRGIVRRRLIKRRRNGLCVPRCASWLATRGWPAQYQQSCGANGLPSRLRAGSNPREAHKQVSHALTGRVLRSNVPRGERSTEAFIYRREASLKRKSWSICAQDGLLGVPNTPARSAREMARLRMLYLSSKGLHPSRIVPYRGTIAGRAYTVCPRGGKAT